MSNDRLQQRRARHHAALASLHPDPNADGLAIWRKLRRIERKANAAACDACNTPAGAERWPKVEAWAELAVRVVFGGTLPEGFFVNGDPRGYTLKLAGRDELGCIPDGMVTDWGGYGLLAAEVN